MKSTALKKSLLDQRGIAMTETALLCFFLYVPLLMMVIVWGDMTLDKTRAHIASAYMSFSSRPERDQVLETFFPGARRSDDEAISVRRANIADPAREAVRYKLPEGRSGDYTGEPPDYDLQYRLYSMGLGRIWLTTHFDASGEEIDVLYETHLSRNEMARYLNRENIVNVITEAEWDELFGEGRFGETQHLDTGRDSRAYSEYAEVLTRMFNEKLTGGASPRHEGLSTIETAFRSPFFRELEREYRRPDESGGLIGRGLPHEFRMQFGPPETLPSPWRDDDSFHTGYAYLRDPAAHPRGDTLLRRIADIGRGGVLSETQNMFRRNVDGVDVNPANMPAAVSGDYGPDHERFLDPGDQR